MSKKYKIFVETSVNVTLKNEKFTPQFMEEFRSNFYPFYELSEHAQHIGQLVAREVIDPIDKLCGEKQFVEGYGPIGEFVLSAEIIETEVGIEE